MNVAIGNDGIDSIYITITPDRISTAIRMTQPYENKYEFYKERNRIGQIFRASTFSYNSMEANHGYYCEENITRLKSTINSINERSIIDLQLHNEIMKKIEEMVAQVKNANDRKNAHFAPIFADFNTHVKNLYNDFKKNKNFIVDHSINQLDNLIEEVSGSEGNLMNAGSLWVYLLLSEGAFEHLIKSLNTEHFESKKHLENLLRGVTSFLLKYEKVIHSIIEKSFIKKPTWLQHQLYIDYKSMIESGKSFSKNYHCPISELNFGKLDFFLPSRFDSKIKSTLIRANL